MAAKEQAFQAFHFEPHSKTSSGICQPAPTQHHCIIREQSGGRQPRLHPRHQLRADHARQADRVDGRHSSSAPARSAVTSVSFPVISQHLTTWPTIMSAVVSASPALVQRSPATAVIQHHHATSPKVHIQAGQQQQVVLPVRTTPLTTQGNVTAAVTSVSFPVTSQHLTTPTLPNHPAGTIQTVKIGGGQAQVGKNSNILCCYIFRLTPYIFTDFSRM